MKSIIQNYNEAYKELYDIHHPIFVEAIKKELELLKDDEVVPMSSPDCEWDTIPTGTYTDAFKELRKDGTALIYNHLACDGDTMAHDEPVSVLNYPIRVLKDVYGCLVIHNRSKRMTEDDMNNLNKLLEHLDHESDLYNSLEKGIKFLKEL